MIGSEVELAEERIKPTKSTNIASYVNRMGHEYFAHQGVTKTGKPKYFASQKRDGAIGKLPKEFIFGESINGIVTIQKPKPSLIPVEDIALVKSKVAELRHLKEYRVETKIQAILIYEPMKIGTSETPEGLNAYSMLDNLKSMIGHGWKDALAKTAKQMGMTVDVLIRADSIVAAAKRKKTEEYMIRNVQYDPVMRFTLDPLLSPYHVERRCYRGDRDWISLGFGTLDKMLKKYVKHVGKESFFELM